MKFIFLHFLMITSIVWIGNLQAEVTPSKMETSIRPSSKIEEMKYLEKKQPASAPPHTTQSLPVNVKPHFVEHVHGADYLHPGILVYLNDKWEGSDHLLNLTNNISVFVTILKPEDVLLEITNAQLQTEIEKIFQEANIKPKTLVEVGKPPLPAFEIEIFVYPIDKGYVACCDGRLLESVILERFKMDSNMAFQAITWEKQSLIVSPKAQFGEQITKNVQDIAHAFVERFKTYEKLKQSATR